MNDILNLVYAVLIIGLACFLVYSNIISIRNARKIYKEQDLKNFKVLDVSKKWLLFYAVMFGMVVLLLILGNTDIQITVVAVGLLFIVVAEMGGIMLRFKLFYNDKMFIYESDVYRIKSIRAVNRGKGRFSKAEVVMFDGKKIIIPNAFVGVLTELYKSKKK